MNPRSEPTTADHGQHATPTDTAAGWRPGDIVISTKHGAILERGASDPFDGSPRWYPLSPAGFEVDEDPTDVVLLARRVDGKRLPVVSLGNGELYAVRSVQ